MIWQRLRDDAADVVLDLSARRGRSLLLLSAVAFSCGALVAAAGVSATASRQISSDLAASGLDQVTVSVAPADTPAAAPVFPTDADERAAGVDLVLGAGTRLDVDRALANPTRTQSTTHNPQLVAQVDVLGATTGYLNAAEATTSSASTWMLDAGTHYKVVFLGPAAARTLGVPTGTADLSGYRIWLDGQPAEVAGILHSAPRIDLSNAVVIPYGEAVTVEGNDSQAHMLVRTAPGGGRPVADVIRTAIRPDATSELTVSNVVDFRSLRSGVQTQLSRLAAGIGALLLILTALLIANSMIVSVVARTSEIGLRRALGASRAAISRLFLIEGALTGVLGGLAGSAVGAGAVVTASAVNGWGAYMPWTLAITGPALGLTVGILASVYPAWRAGHISPATAIRVD